MTFFFRISRRLSLLRERRGANKKRDSRDSPTAQERRGKKKKKRKEIKRRKKKEEEETRRERRRATFRRDWISSPPLSRFPRVRTYVSPRLVRLGISRLHHREFFAAHVCARLLALVRSHARTHARSARPAAPRRATYVLQARRTKLWPVSIGRALRVVYRSTFWSCNTRPDTDRRGCRAAAAAAAAAARHQHDSPYRRSTGPSIGTHIGGLERARFLRNCRPAGRSDSGKNPSISSG